VNLYTYVPSDMDSKARAAVRFRHVYIHTKTHISFFHVGVYICVRTCICISIYIRTERHGFKGTSSSEDQACVGKNVNAHVILPRMGWL